ncbi:hypothetical protein DET49_11243 [Salegentibacter sp. 24]|nr:hypothetical protein DET49_11243 [Salegentibacter sp. 24]
MRRKVMVKPKKITPPNSDGVIITEFKRFKQEFLR